MLFHPPPTYPYGCCGSPLSKVIHLHYVVHLVLFYIFHPPLPPVFSSRQDSLKLPTYENIFYDIMFWSESVSAETESTGYPLATPLSNPVIRVQQHRRDNVSCFDSEAHTTSLNRVVASERQGVQHDEHISTQPPKRMRVRTAPAISRISSNRVEQ